MSTTDRTSTPRLTDEQALHLYRAASLHELGRRAAARTAELHPEPYRTYVVDRNINYANVCTARCLFCNFSRQPGDDAAYVLSFVEIGRKIEELLAIGGTQILMQGGLVPGEDHPSGQGRPFSWYLELLRFVKTHYPTIHIHAFSPPEIWAFHRMFDIPLADVLRRLQDAGLDTIPGGGGEILVDRVRRKIGRGKAMTDEWLGVMRAAHQIGMKTSCTMMFGHIETIPERIEHLRRLRDLQDETGGFTAFIHWPFQPEGTPLGRWSQAPAADTEVGRCEGSRESVGDRRRPRGADATKTAGTETGRYEVADRNDAPGVPLLLSSADSSDSAALAATLRPEPDGERLFLADADAYLRLLAVARLYLDNIPNIQSSWVTMGPKIGQLALLFGANDMGSVMMEENVVSSAGTTFRLNEEQIRRLITDAGWTPRRRDQYYRPLDDPPTASG
ncbi:MAG: radical SAM protein [Phycisphaerae bacterium]|jgi:cyclic dehypoxanthinyl futalosine synthase